MNNECKSAGFGFIIFFIYSSLVNSPSLIKYGCLMCSITGILCHNYGYRILDLYTTCIFIFLNIYYAYRNKYLNSSSIIFSFIGSVMYLNKTSHHVLFVQTPFFISIYFLIENYKAKLIQLDLHVLFLRIKYKSIYSKT